MARERTQYRMLPYREKRKDRRMVAPPILVTFDGRSYETDNWSFGGFLLQGCTAGRARGEAIVGSLGWDGQVFPFTGRVTRAIAATRELGVSFEKIGGDALAFLNARLGDYLTPSRRKA
jgi:hypothetical protein